MTESEIMKALECCCDGKITRCIKECPLKDFDGECYSAMKRDILALINRKNAEIEKYQIDGETLAISLLNAKKEIERLHSYSTYKHARAEAIKEFAERVKNYYSHLKEGSCGASIGFYIDQIAKEMGVEL